MSKKTPKYSYFLAIFFGLIALFISASASLIIIALVFLVAGGLFGFLWPKEIWRWGLWIAGPMIILLGLSVLFAGQLDIFIRKDLPPLLVALVSACLGSFLSSRYKRRQNSL